MEGVILLGIALIVCTVLYCAGLGALGRRRQPTPDEHYEDGLIRTLQQAAAERQLRTASTSTGYQLARPKPTRAQRDRNRDRMAKKSRSRNRH